MFTVHWPTSLHSSSCNSFRVAFSHPESKGRISFYAMWQIRPAQHVCHVADRSILSWQFASVTLQQRWNKCLSRMWMQIYFRRLGIKGLYMPLCKVVDAPFNTRVPSFNHHHQSVVDNSGLARVENESAAIYYCLCSCCCTVVVRCSILVQVTIYRRLLIGRDGHLDQDYGRVGLYAMATSQ